MRRLFLFFMASLSGAALYSQSLDIAEAALIIIGMERDCEEVVDMEHFEQLNAHPLSLNSSSRAQLARSGLFTPFQIASIIDYRARYGEIYSFAELKSLGSFSQDYVDALRCFVSLEPVQGVDYRDSPSRLHNTLAGRYSDSSTSGKTCSAKDNLVYGEAAAVNLAFRRDTEETVYKGSASLGWRSLHIVAGDYYVRFGQGLCKNQGQMISSYKTLGSLSKKTSSIRPGSSYSCYGASRGAALQLDLVRSEIDCYYDALTGAWGGYYQHYSRNVFYGALVNREEGRTDVTFEARASAGPVMFYTESGYAAKELATASGVRLRLGDHLSSGVLVRYNTPDSRFIPSDLLAACVMEYQTRKYTLTASVSEHKTAKVVQDDASVSGLFRLGKNLQWNASASWREKDTGYRKTLLKTDLRYACGDFNAQLFAQAVHVKSDGFLIGGEVGWKKTYFRYAYWDAPTWDDRLYLCIRSSPGSFIVPGLHLNGMLFSGYSAWKIGKSLSVHLTAYAIAYNQNKSDKPLKTVGQVEIIWTLR